MGHSDSSSRRQFIKTFVVGTASATILGRPWRGALLAETIPPEPDSTGILRIRLSDFPTLLEPFGSVRIGVNPVGSDEFPAGNFYPILVNRGLADQFYALDAECGHASCVVQTYETDINAMTCPCHGSEYAIDGTVIARPSMRSLKRLASTFDGTDSLTIRVPNLGYSIRGAAVQAGSRARFKIEFPTFPLVQYEVQFRPNANSGWSPIPFSTSPDTEASQMFLTGDEEPAVLYVDPIGGSGFYTVSMRVLDLS